MLKVSEDTIAEIKDLIDTGDVKLADERAKFKEVMKRDTTLDDEALIKAIAATDDDDTELFCKNVLVIEQELAGAE